MSICPNCGRENADGNRFCESCGSDLGMMKGGPIPNVTNNADTVSGGYSYQSGGYQYSGNSQNVYGSVPPVKEDNTTVCILSLIFGILSLCGCNCCYIFPIAAIVLGIIGIVNNGSKKGLAIAGVICGALGIVIWPIIDTLLAPFTGFLSYFV